MAERHVQERMVEREPLMSQDDQRKEGNSLRIIRGRVDSLSLYEITETELDTLERGSPYSIYLNFGVFLLTLGLSFLTSLLTTDTRSSMLLIVFVTLTVVGLIGGTFLIMLWHNTRKEVSEVVKRIKTRIADTEPHGRGHDDWNDRMS